MDFLIWLTASVVCGLFVFYLYHLIGEVEPQRSVRAGVIALVSAIIALVYWPDNWASSTMWWLLKLPFRSAELMIVVALVGAYFAFMSYEGRRNDKRRRNRQTT